LNLAGDDIDSQRRRTDGEVEVSPFYHSERMAKDEWKANNG
jgi:hypothetical protein